MASPQLSFEAILEILKEAPPNTYPSEYILERINDTQPARAAFIAFIQTHGRQLLQILSQIPFRASLKGGFALVVQGLPVETPDIDLAALEPFTDESRPRLVGALHTVLPAIDGPAPSIADIPFIASPPIVKGAFIILHRKKPAPQPFEKVEVILRLGEYQDTLIDYSYELTSVPAEFLQPISEYLTVFHPRVLTLQNKIVFRNRMSLLRSKMIDYDNCITNLLFHKSDYLVKEEARIRNILLQNRAKLYEYMNRLLALRARLDIVEPGEASGKMAEKSILQLLGEYAYATQIYRNFFQYLINQPLFRTQYQPIYNKIVSDYNSIVSRPPLLDRSESARFLPESYQALLETRAADDDEDEAEEKDDEEEALLPAAAEPIKNNEKLENILKNVAAIDSIVTPESFYDKSDADRLNLFKVASNRQRAKENAQRKQKEREREAKQLARLKRREKEVKEASKAAAVEKEDEALLAEALKERPVNYDAKLCYILFEPILTDPSSRFILELEALFDDEEIPKKPTFIYSAALMPLSLTSPISSHVDTQTSTVAITTMFFYSFYNFCKVLSSSPQLTLNNYYHAVAPMQGFIKGNIIGHGEFSKFTGTSKMLAELLNTIQFEFNALLKLEPSFKALLLKQVAVIDVPRYQNTVSGHIIRYFTLFENCFKFLLEILVPKEPAFTAAIKSLISFLSSKDCIKYIDTTPHIALQFEQNKALDRIKNIFVKVYQTYFTRQIVKIPSNKIPVTIALYPSDLKLDFNLRMDKFQSNYLDESNNYLKKRDVTKVNLEEVFIAPDKRERVFTLYDLNLKIIQNLKKGDLFPPSIIDSPSKTLQELVYNDIIIGLTKKGYIFPRKAYRATRDFLKLIKDTSWHNLFIRAINNPVLPDPIFLDIMLRTSDHIWREDDLRVHRFIELLYKLWIYSTKILDASVLINSPAHWKSIYEFVTQDEMSNVSVEDAIRAWFVTHEHLIQQALDIHFGKDDNVKGGARGKSRRKAYNRTYKKRRSPQ